MNYLQMGALCVVGLVAIIIWWTCFVGLNRDVTYHNKRTRGPYAVPRRKKRAVKPMRKAPNAQQTVAKQPRRGR